MDICMFSYAYTTRDGLCQQWPDRHDCGGTRWKGILWTTSDNCGCASERKSGLRFAVERPGRQPGPCYTNARSKKRSWGKLALADLGSEVRSAVRSGGDLPGPAVYRLLNVTRLKAHWYYNSPQQWSVFCGWTRTSEYYVWVPVLALPAVFHLRAIPSLGLRIVRWFFACAYEMEVACLWC